MTVSKVTRFSVSGLYGDTNVSLRIRDNKIVLIGVNGIGKSTILNLLYYFLSRQWGKLLDYQFETLSVRISNEVIDLTRDDIESGIERRNIEDERRSRRFPSVIRRINDLRYRMDFDDFLLPDPLTPEQRRRYSRLLNVPISLLDRIRIDYRIHYANRSFDEELPILDDPLHRAETIVTQAIDAQILYLPTYRRIERDLEAIFPEFRDEIQRYHARRPSLPDQSTNVYVELVQFGMEDVDHSIQSALTKMKDTARAELTTLTGNYLRDVIRENAHTYDAELIDALDADTIAKILSRIEEPTLSEQDKGRLQDAIQRIKSGGQIDTPDTDKYIAHFFSQLALSHQKLSQEDSRIRQFIEIVNKYLVDKILDYDDVNYEVEIKKKKREIPLSALSSGEKQIVSLFTHLILGPADDYIVVIDEPELSLSVDWQTSLLPDLSATGRCSLIATATHSPFIFDNEFENHTVDLAQYLKVR